MHHILHFIALFFAGNFATHILQDVSSYTQSRGT